MGDTWDRFIRTRVRLLAFGLAGGLILSPAAALAQDTDGDGVADAVDNCPFVPNGPNEPSNQANDGMPDAFGNACDTDYDGNGFTGTTDLSVFLSGYDAATRLDLPETDADGDGDTSIGDWATFYYYWDTVGAGAPSNPNQPFGLAPSSSVQIEIRSITVDAGLVYGHSVVLPIGATVTIDSSVSIPAEAPVVGLGLSYQGFDPALLDFVDGQAASSLLTAVCLEQGNGEAFGFGGLVNRAGQPGAGGNRALDETPANPMSPTEPGGAPRVIVARALALAAAPLTNEDPRPEPGLDGICGNEDPQFRVRFAGIADGFTEIEIGTGADLGDVVVVEATAERAQASNARLRIAVPEVSGRGAMRVALLWMGLLIGAARSRKHRATTG
ncbi:MAG: thrombospondin type 3 repeat-containing protein [Myxococcota bacterium]